LPESDLLRSCNSIPTWQPDPQYPMRPMFIIFLVMSGPRLFTGT